MELIKFNGKTYGRENTQLYVFEELWDTFRPIQKVAWNGKKIAIDDSMYKINLFDPVYGFGTQEMKSHCKFLTGTTELECNEISSPQEFWNWCRTPTEWFHDRPCVLSGCGPHNWKKYISYTGSHPRTLRRAPGVRVTRRLVGKGVKL